MSVGAHWLILLSKWLGLHNVIDVKDPVADSEAIWTSDDKVSHAREPGVMLDVTMDDMTCVATEPPSNSVIVTKGRAHWYGYRLELEEELLSVEIDMYLDAECDPAEGGSHRYALLCLYRDMAGETKTMWAYSGGGFYPRVPHNMVPLCYVRQEMGQRIITSADIENWRTIHPASAPSVEYLFPPVLDPGELEKYTNVPDMAVSFVANAAMWYFYYNGTWSPQSAGTFDSTFYSVDVPEDTSETPLPWSILSYPEVTVFRDGLLMTPGKDYYILFGPAARIMWRQVIYKNMRIVCIRNPFLGMSFDPGGGADVYDVVHYWVDGVSGMDSFPGTEEAPFKTLQRAFDCLPYSSRNEFILHVSRLQLEDKITYSNPAVSTYGLLINRQLRSLVFEISDDCQWDPNEMDWLYVLYNVSSVYYNGKAIKYPFQWMSSYGTIVSCSIETNVLGFDGGQYTLYNVTQASGRIMVDGLAQVRLAESEVNQVYARYAGHLISTRSKIQGLISDTEALLHLTDTEVLTSITTDNSDVVLINALWPSGLFTASHVSALQCVLKGTPEDLRPTPFTSTGGTLHLTGCQIAFTAGPAVLLQDGAYGDVKGGDIERTGWGAGIVCKRGSTVNTSGGLNISSCSSNGIFLTMGSMGNVTQTQGAFNQEYGIYCNMYSTCERDLSTVNLQGNIAPYREDSAGSNTVGADGADYYPSTLDQKLKGGIGIKFESKEYPPPANNRILEASLDLAQLADPDGPFQTVLVTNPKLVVFKYLYDIAPGDMVDVAVPYAGVSFLSSVTRRVNNPTPQLRQTLTDTTTEPYFIQQDSYIGTEFTDAGWRLKERPALGYPAGSPYYMVTIPTSRASLVMYAIGNVSSLSIDADVPAGASVRCGISVNGGKAFKRWTGTEWVNLPGESVASQLNFANTIEQVNAYPEAAWQMLKSTFNPVYVDLGFSILTSDPAVTPLLKSYSWAFVEDGYNLDVSEKFERMFYPTRAMFRSIADDVMQPPFLFTVYPVHDYAEGPMN